MGGEKNCLLMIINLFTRLRQTLFWNEVGIENGEQFMCMPILFT